VGIDENNEKILYEINGNPGFGIFLRDNCPEELVEMYKRILVSVLHLEKK
jgi:hypothetical protein